ncbi:MAG: DUF2784 domain-containing protein [Thermodesulfobacteriota bacterium]
MTDPVTANLLADMLLVAHLLFIVFVVVGGVLVWQRPRLALLHLPAALWGALVEIMAWPCPLTSLENRLRQAAGRRLVDDLSFVDRYVVPLVYPPGLDRQTQMGLGLAVLLINLLLYAFILRARRRKK